METKNKRKQIADGDIGKGLHELAKSLEHRFDQKGKHVLVSSHEILGVLVEEMDELKEAVRSNDIERICKELMDVAVAGIFGYICKEYGYTDW